MMGTLLQRERKITSSELSRLVTTSRTILGDFIDYWLRNVVDGPLT